MKNKLSIILVILLFSISIFAASPGSLDSSFGVGGIFNLTTVGAIQLFDSAIQSDGKIIITTRNDTQDFVIVRLTNNGSLDTSFSDDGISSIDFGGVDRANQVCIQTDNKIVIFGSTNTGIAIARLNPDGSNDLSFSGDGLTTLAFGDFPTDCAIQTDGKLLFTIARMNNSFTVGRLNANGTVDTSFGVNGIVNTVVVASDLFTSGLKLQPDGKIVVIGQKTVTFKESVVLRYNSNGSLDSTFDGNGVASFNFAPEDEFLQHIQIQTNGKIILGISRAVSSGNTGVIKVARLLANGTLDNTFGNNGVTDIDLPNTTLDTLDELFIESDESILAVVNMVAPSASYSFLNLNGNNGAITTKYGPNGFAPFFFTFLSTSTLLGDKLIIGNSSGVVSFRRFNLAKTPTITSDFDGDGVTDTAVYRPSTGNWFILRSSDNSFVAFQFGLNGDVPIDGDFDGDGKSDLAIFRPSNGVWFFRRSSDGTNLGVTFGNSTDRPIPGDYDKDGKTDIAVFRPSTGEWLILRSSTNFSTFFGYPFGQNGDIPISSERK